MARENLEDVYNTLVALENFDWNSLPANNKYRKYKEYKQDPDIRKLPEASRQSTGRKQTVGIQPFGLDFSDDNKIKIKMSGRAHTWIEGQAALKDACNYLVGTTAGLKTNISLIPGKATFAQILATPRSVSASSNRVTGKAYQRGTGETYTVPYGAGTATMREFDVQDQIVTAAATINFAVTFESESFSRKR